MILWHISRNVGQCQPLDTEEECLCCREIDVMASRLDKAEVKCITEHDGFQTLVLNVHVINTAY